MDYSEHFCLQAGFPDEAVDILNEVVCDLLKKDSVKLIHMRNTASKCGKYKELDIYVLRMIRLNIFSPTSPYQSRYKSLPANEETDFSRIRIIDEVEDGEDRPAQILEQHHRVIDAYEGLYLSPKARAVFEHRFLNNLPFSEWPGDEPKPELYDIYNRVIGMIRAKIEGRTLF